MEEGWGFEANGRGRRGTPRRSGNGAPRQWRRRPRPRAGVRRGVGRRVRVLDTEGRGSSPGARPSPRSTPRPAGAVDAALPTEAPRCEGAHESWSVTSSRVKARADRGRPFTPLRRGPRPPPRQTSGSLAPCGGPLRSRVDARLRVPAPGTGHFRCAARIAHDHDRALRPPTSAPRAPDPTNPGTALDICLSPQASSSPLSSSIGR